MDLAGYRVQLSEARAKCAELQAALEHTNKEIIWTEEFILSNLTDEELLQPENLDLLVSSSRLAAERASGILAPEGSPFTLEHINSVRADYMIENFTDYPFRHAITKEAADALQASIDKLPSGMPVDVNIPGCGCYSWRCSGRDDYVLSLQAPSSNITVRNDGIKFQSETLYEALTFINKEFNVEEVLIS